MANPRAWAMSDAETAGRSEGPLSEKGGQGDSTVMEPVICGWTGQWNV